MSRVKLFKLRQNADFFAQARIKKSPHLRLYFLPSSSCQSKLSVIVSKKAAPLATTRNAIKRRLKAEVQDFISRQLNEYQEGLNAGEQNRPGKIIVIRVIGRYIPHQTLSTLVQEVGVMLQAL